MSHIPSHIQFFMANQTSNPPQHTLPYTSHPVAQFGRMDDGAQVAWLPFSHSNVAHGGGQAVFAGPVPVAFPAAGAPVTAAAGAPTGGFAAPATPGSTTPYTTTLASGLPAAAAAPARLSMPMPGAGTPYTTTLGPGQPAAAAAPAGLPQPAPIPHADEETRRWIMRLNTAALNSSSIVVHLSEQPADKFLDLLTVYSDNGRTALLELMLVSVDSFAAVLQMMENKLTPSDRAEVLKKRDGMGFTILQCAMHYRTNRLPHKDDIPNVLLYGDDRYNAFTHLLGFIIRNLSAAGTCSLIANKDLFGRNILHTAAEDHRTYRSKLPSLVQLMGLSMQSPEIKALLTDQDQCMNTALHALARHSHTTFVNVFTFAQRRFSLQELPDLLAKRNLLNETVIDTLKRYHPEQTATITILECQVSSDRADQASQQHAPPHP